MLSDDFLQLTPDLIADASLIIVLIAHKTNDHMKKISSAALVIVTICTIQVNAQNFVSTSAKNSFRQTFDNATNVEWQQIDDNILLVWFNYQQESKLAYFDAQGTLLREGRRISFDNTPQMVQTEVKNLIDTYSKSNGLLQVIHTYEVFGGGKPKYYLNVGNSRILLSLLSDVKGDIKILRNQTLSAPQAKVLARN